MSRRLLIFAVGVACGVTMLGIGIVLGGLGEGSPIPLSVVGAPLTFVPIYIVAIPGYWLILAALIAYKRWPVAALWLTCQLISIPFVVSVQLKSGGLSDDQALLRQVLDIDPGTFVFLSCVYLAAHAVAWTVVVRGAMADRAEVPDEPRGDRS